MPLQLSYRRTSPSSAERKARRFWDTLAVVIWSCVLAMIAGGFFLALLV